MELWHWNYTYGSRRGTNEETKKEYTKVEEEREKGEVDTDEQKREK